MSNFYMIRTLDRDIQFNQQDIYQSITIRSRKINYLENKRVGFIYSVHMNRDFTEKEKLEYLKIVEQLKNTFKEESYPEFLLAIGEPDCAIELSTKMPITAKYDAAISVREVTEEQFITYLNEHPEYASEVKHFLEPPNNVIDFKEALKRIRNKK